MIVNDGTIDSAPDTVTISTANSTPTANAGPDQIVECTSPAGASFTLDGRGSSDPDQDLVLFGWREDSRTGPVVGDGPRATQALGVGIAKSYFLRVIDGHAAGPVADRNASAMIVNTGLKPPFVT